MKKLIILSLVLICLFVFSCESTTFEQISVVNTNPTYAANVNPIITANCTGCHSSGGQYPALETYSQVKEAIQNGDVICRIDTQSCGEVMPTSGRMSQGTIDLIKLWATNGYPNQ
jgi:hypothetical protein